MLFNDIFTPILIDFQLSNRKPRFLTCVTQSWVGDFCAEQHATCTTQENSKAPTFFQLYGRSFRGENSEDWMTQSKCAQSGVFRHIFSMKRFCPELERRERRRTLPHISQLKSMLKIYFLVKISGNQKQIFGSFQVIRDTVLFRHSIIKA